jgi:sugar phosphate isomerase/epimerase
VTPRVLASTTSHKREPLVPVLEIFSRLGLLDLDLNLHHLIEAHVPVDAVAAAVARGGQRVFVVSGGWCDFFHPAPRIEETDRSVDRQVALAQALGVGTLRLFFGRLPRDAFSPDALATVTAHLRRLSDRHPDMLFVFENHDGASLVPGICRDVLARVSRANILMNFDPINFERAGVDSAEALAAVRPFVGHVHLKGLDRGEYCEFGEGDVDLAPLVRSLIDSGYDGRFSVEYEGTFDGTLRLYRSVQRARALIDARAG